MPTLVLGGHSYTVPSNRDCFINPATGEVYAWPVNHAPSGEQRSGKTRNIAHTSNTGNVGLVKQQGDDSPFAKVLQGTILDRAHEVQMWRWWGLSRAATIYFVEFNGDAYEVQITDYSQQRVGAGGYVTHSGLGYIATYEIHMEVYAFLLGVMFEAGVTP